MKYQFTPDEARTHLQDLIEAALNGYEIFIIKDDQQAVQLVPIEPPKRQAKFGSAAGLIWMADPGACYRSGWS